ncbi:MAG: hypothetical protein U0Y68_06020 [Blastocatellia bacterium]
MTLEMIEDNYASMAELAKRTASSLCSFRLAGARLQAAQNDDGASPEKILKLNEWLKNYCAASNYLDYFSKMVDEQEFLKKELANCGLHPNAEGYKIMAPLAEAAIQETLKKKKITICLYLSAECRLV